MHKTVNMMKVICRFYILSIKSINESQGDHKITMTIIKNQLREEIGAISGMKNYDPKMAL